MSDDELFYQRMKEAGDTLEDLVRVMADESDDVGCLLRLLVLPQIIQLDLRHLQGKFLQPCEKFEDAICEKMNLLTFAVAQQVARVGGNLPRATHHAIKGAVSVLEEHAISVDAAFNGPTN